MPTLASAPSSGTVASEIILPTDTEYLAFWFWWVGHLGNPANWYQPIGSTNLTADEQASIFAAILETETRT